MTAQYHAHIEDTGQIFFLDAIPLLLSFIVKVYSVSHEPLESATELSAKI